MIHFLHSIGYAFATVIIFVPFTSRTAFRELKSLMEYCDRNRHKRGNKKFREFGLRCIFSFWALDTFFPALTVFLITL